MSRRWNRVSPCVQLSTGSFVSHTFPCSTPESVPGLGVTHGSAAGRRPLAEPPPPRATSWSAGAARGVSGERVLTAGCVSRALPPVSSGRSVLHPPAPLAVPWEPLPVSPGRAGVLLRPRLCHGAPCPALPALPGRPRCGDAASSRTEPETRSSAAQRSRTRRSQTDAQCPRCGRPEPVGLRPRRLHSPRRRPCPLQAARPSVCPSVRLPRPPIQILPLASTGPVTGRARLRASSSPRTRRSCVPDAGAREPEPSFGTCRLRLGGMSLRDPGLPRRTSLWCPRPRPPEKPSPALPRATPGVARSREPGKPLQSGLHGVPAPAGRLRPGEAHPPQMADARPCAPQSHLPGPQESRRGTGRALRLTRGPRAARGLGTARQGQGLFPALELPFFLGRGAGVIPCIKVSPRQRRKTGSRVGRV